MKCKQIGTKSNLLSKKLACISSQGIDLLPFLLQQKRLTFSKMLLVVSANNGWGRWRWKRSDTPCFTDDPPLCVWTRCTSQTIPVCCGNMWKGISDSRVCPTALRWCVIENKPFLVRHPPLAISFLRFEWVFCFHVNRLISSSICLIWSFVSSFSSTKFKSASTLKWPSHLLLGPWQGNRPIKSKSCATPWHLPLP